MSEVEFRKMLYEVYDIDSLVLVNSIQKYVAIVEVTNIRTYYRTRNKVRNIFTIGRRAKSIFNKQWQNNYTYLKIKIIFFIIHCRRNNAIFMDKSKIIRGQILPYLTEVLLDILDLPFVQNKHYQC